jgi:fused signal recognition particle receptor
MIDAEEAEARARVDTELEEARARAADQARREAAAAERARHEAEELERIQLEMERRQNARPSSRAATSEPNVESPQKKEPLLPARRETKTVAPLQSRLTYKAILREEARRIAALEKQEARERKALAKAAARRRGERQLPY